MIERLRQQLIETSRESTRRQHELQTSLHATQQFLEEVKLEYRQFSERTVNEAAELERRKKADYDRVRMVLTLNLILYTISTCIFSVFVSSSFSFPFLTFLTLVPTRLPLILILLPAPS